MTEIIHSLWAGVVILGGIGVAVCWATCWLIAGMIAIHDNTASLRLRIMCHAFVWGTLVVLFAALHYFGAIEILR